jgi:hypothetical protein
MMATETTNASNGGGTGLPAGDDTECYKGLSYADFPRYFTPLAAAKPFLVPTFDNQVVELLPAEKANRKICWDENILVQEIANRYGDMEVDEGEEDSYEIEIVDDDGDADFYLEIVDGEVFYVFETEDDLSDEEESDDEDDESTVTAGDASTAAHSEIVSESDYEMSTPDVGHTSSRPVHLPTSMALPSLDEDGSVDADSSPLPEPKGPALIEPDSDCDGAAEVTASNACPATEPTLMSIDENDADSEVFSMKSLRSQSRNTPPATEGATSSGVTSDAKAFAEPDDAQLSPTQVRDSSERTSSTDAAVVPASPPATVTASSGYTTPVQKKKESLQIPLVDMVPTSPASSSAPPLSPGNTSNVTPRSILKACPESPKKPMTPKKPRDKSKPKEKKEKTFTKTYVRAEQYNCETTVSYAWEKPSWTNKQLRSTDKGEQVRKGGNLANPITFPNKLPANADLLQEEGLEIDGVEYEQVDKEELIRRLKGGSHGRHRKLKFSINGAKIRDGGDIVQPITKATVFRKPENINKIANQDVLKKTAIGDAVKEGMNLAQPVTLATVNKTYQWEKPEWAKRLESRKENSDEISIAVSSRGFVSPSKQKKTYTWEKPSWTKQRLATTENGDAVKEGANLARPITQLPDLVRQDEQERQDQTQ